MLPQGFSVPLQDTAVFPSAVSVVLASPFVFTVCDALPDVLPRLDVLPVSEEQLYEPLSEIDTLTVCGLCVHHSTFNDH